MRASYKVALGARMAGKWRRVESGDTTGGGKEGEGLKGGRRFACEAGEQNSVVGCYVQGGQSWEKEKEKA